MPIDTALNPAAAPPRDVAHAVSPGLWTLAWRRLKTDSVAMVSLAIVAAFILLMITSGLGLVAKDWAKEVGVNYAPPSWITLGAADAPTQAPLPAGAGEPATLGPTPGSAFNSTVVDPLADVISELKGGRKADAGASDAVDENKVVDPLADVMKDIRSGQANAKDAPAAEERRATLPFGGDKWGRDIIAKTVKGSETSIFVGLAAALVAVFIGTVLGAFAGYYGRWVDDVLNWFYSIFSSIPYLLLILAVAAVLQQKGTFTIVLILGLTGWAGVFRLIRAEYLKHKGREYVMAADALGASNSRKMFLHIFPNVSHVVLVQLSILTVGFIKAEVILSFLGFGVPVDVVSWGSMLNEAQNELILGKWWQLVAATAAMATLVTAFSLFTDALRDALDPKLKGRTGH
ncbi:MAG TPA: ABC transporter permease [Casimicrobiaceae bacterium]|nr:ABC transporter permease [Casimicrobiaceae bacterium]